MLKGSISGVSGDSSGIETIKSAVQQECEIFVQKMDSMFLAMKSQLLESISEKIITSEKNLSSILTPQAQVLPGNASSDKPIDLALPKKMKFSEVVMKNSVII